LPDTRADYGEVRMAKQWLASQPVEPALDAHKHASFNH
jgi:hypothetical protein